MTRNIPTSILATFVLLIICQGNAASEETDHRRPNVILIMTDDQGYGEVAMHGNPIIKTPNMDKQHGAYYARVRYMPH